MYRDRPERPTDLGDLQRQMERFLEYLAAGKRPRFPIATGPWQPAVDVAEGPDRLTVTVDIAGVDPSHIQVLVDGMTLVIRGVRRHHRTEQLTYHLMEIGAGPFERIIQLPVSVDAERADAVYVNGMLQIILPKVARTTIGRRVLIQTG